MPSDQTSSAPNGDSSAEPQPSSARTAVEAPIPQEAEEAIKGVGMMIAGATLVAKAIGAMIAAGAAIWHLFSPHSTGR